MDAAPEFLTEHEADHDQQAPLDKFIPQRLNSTPLLKGIEADRRLAVATSPFVKWAFLLTNAPYWILFAGALARFADEMSRDLLHVDTHWCERSEAYVVMSLLVALSSTMMHGSQMRMGHHLCCGDVDRARKFHQPSLQIRLKQFDIGCAVAATLASTTCHSWKQLALCAVIAVPCFFGGIILKRIEWHSAYLFTHGLWHIVTALPALHSFFGVSPFSLVLGLDA